MILDLFSGGGAGWCLGARTLGLPSVGIEWDGPACKTRSVVGLSTIRATVMGDQRVFPPGGHHGTEAGDPKSWSSQAIPVEPWELGVLQGFAPDHPWQPPRVSAQIGNAVPPPLALACLRSVTGLA